MGRAWERKWSQGGERGGIGSLAVDGRGRQKLERGIRSMEGMGIGRLEGVGLIGREVISVNCGEDF